MTAAHHEGALRAHRERESDELYELVAQAWELRGSPYFRDACEAVVEWHQRRRLRRIEVEGERDALALRLLGWRPAAPTNDEEQVAP
jgi:hypothetical protein